MEELLKELAEAKQKIADIEKKIEEKQAETGRWKPEVGDRYWFINSYGQAAHEIWNNNRIDNDRYEIGNLFKTEVEANSAIEKLKVIAELKEYEEPKNRAWDGENSHYTIFFNTRRKAIDVDYIHICKSGEIYFESEEKVQQAIDAVGEDRIKKYYLEVEE